MKFAIIAAGHGSRLAQEGVEKPKPLVELDGQPMLGRLIGIFLACGAQEIAIITNTRMPEVAAYARSLSLPVPLRLTVLDTPSSMHSFSQVARSLGGSGKCIVTTVDTVFRPSDFEAYAQAFEVSPSDLDGLMAVTDYIDDEKPLYVGVGPDMAISQFSDSPCPGEQFVSAGIYGLRLEKAMPVLEACLANGTNRMRNFQRALLADGLRLRAWSMGPVGGGDHASDIAKAESLLRN